jgi:hypothetical protein
VKVEKVFLVWNADHGLRADLAYVLKKLRGIEECALCGLTHGRLTESREWKDCKRQFGVPFEGVHRDRLNGEQARAADGDLPCVLAQTPAGLVKLLGSEEIGGCAGDLHRFTQRLRASIDEDAAVSARSPAS